VRATIATVDRAVYRIDRYASVNLVYHNKSIDDHDKENRTEQNLILRSGKSEAEVTDNTLWFKKNAPTLADYNYDPVQSILIIFSKLFVNDHKRCLVVKFSTSPHICCHYIL